jgi:hypothetical protein
MRKIYLGFERSDFDVRFLKLISKASGPYLGKLLTYYLLSLDWVSSEDLSQLKKDLKQKLSKLVDKKKILFENERKCFLHQLSVSLIEFMLVFLEDKYLIQLIYFKDHNFTNIMAFISNCTCEFKGLVYLNMRIEKEIKFLKFLLNFDYKYQNDVNVQVLIRFVKNILRKEYAFMDELMTSFRKKYENIKNETLLMEFYDCYSEFLGNSKLLNKLYVDFDWFFKDKKMPRIQLIYIDEERDSEMEKTLFFLKKKKKDNFIPTKVSESK